MAGRRQPAVCLLHGWASAADVWVPLHPALPGDCAVVNYAGVTSPAGFGAAVRAALPAAPAVIVGWSLGAVLALELALAEPARVRGLFLIAGTPRFVSDDPQAGWPAAVLARLKARVARAPQPALAAFQGQLFAPAETAARERYAARFAPGDPGEFTPAGLAAGLDYLATTDLSAALRRIHCPVCWLHGDADVICPPGALAAVPPAPRVRRLPGVGHLPFWSQPETVGQELAAFVSRLTPRHDD